MSGIYDVTLANGASANIAALGTYGKIYSAPAGSVQMRFDGGEAYSLMEGQGVRFADSAKPFRDVTIKNTSGASQTVLVFIGDSRFEDTRITGTVSVVDGGKARTVAAVAFMAYQGGTSGGGLIPIFELYHPAATGKRSIVKRIIISSTVAGTALLTTSAATTGTLTGSPYQKLVGSAAAFSGQMYRDLTLAVQPGSTFLAFSFGANQVVEKVFEEPIVLVPGQGLIVGHSVVATTMQVAFEGYEEANV